MKDIWSSYTFIDHYMHEIHQLIKSGKLERFTLESIIHESDRLHIKKKKDTFGIISHISRKINPRRAFVDTVACTENFLKFLVSTVYYDYPRKLLNNVDMVSSTQDKKIIEIIIDSENKEEIIDKLVEEKVRSIFYGDPLGFFLSARMKLEFSDFFKEHHKDNLAQFAEIMARRNIYMHNDGKVDRKYLREIKSAQYKLDQKAVINREYLRKTILLLRGLCATASALIIVNIYKQRPLGKVGQVYRQFNSHVPSL